MEVETVQQWLPYVGGGVIIPIIMLLKKTVIVQVIRPEFLKLVLFALTAWGMFAWLYPGVPVEFAQIMDMAFQGVGVAATLWAGGKLFNGK